MAWVAKPGDEKIGGAELLRWPRSRWELYAGQRVRRLPPLGGKRGRALEWLLRSHVHRHSSGACQMEQAQHIRGARRNVREPIDNRDRFDLHILAREQEGYGHQIVAAGVGIDNYGTLGGKASCQQSDQETTA